MSPLASLAIIALGIVAFLAFVGMSFVWLIQPAIDEMRIRRSNPDWFE